MKQKNTKPNSKKRIVITLLIIGILLSAIGFYFYNKKHSFFPVEIEPKVAECVVRGNIQLYVVNPETLEFEKYKVLPLGSKVNVMLNNWVLADGYGYYYRLSNYEGRNDVFAEEIIHKYISNNILEYFSFNNLNYYEVFPTDDYNDIPYKFQSCIVDFFYQEQLHKNKRWRFSSISDRAKSTFAIDNFTSEKEKDIAIILESEDTRSHALYFFHRDDNQRCNTVYTATYGGGSPIIKVFKKNDLIYQNGNTLKPAPNNGIILEFYGGSYRSAILYDPNLKSFMDYTQYITPIEKNEELEEFKEPNIQKDANDIPETQELETDSDYLE